jgi:hypothetical protein
MDAAAIQEAKNQFAQAQNPPLESCTNASCKFTGCTCGGECGCNAEKSDVTCDPCVEFKKEMMQKKKGLPE